ncbi:hypothetical protein ACFSYG_11970 [Leeuwenhoekiella polynyae]|uniref:DUF3575 domain-containing protein n=1 Tax=Leeuwenhoekiella polynyae TaxID=1550906 RepID=A0A4Q0PGE2_9FLAO|nr:hypothetical protein [Leeuwenhoekiella polynyae]RXG25688.1 hypothetical protein DSM02_855 [Leeuwenhoekiella polynyae]
MKNLFKILVLFCCFTAAAQQGGNVLMSTDAKILAFGSNNQYTIHGPTPNLLVLVEYQDKLYHKWRGYAFAGYEWVNLPQWYQSYFMGYGASFKMARKIDLIPSLEGGFILRERTGRTAAGSWFIGANLDLRYYLNSKLALSLRPNLELATDLPGRKFRYQATTGLVILNLWK